MMMQGESKYGRKNGSSEDNTFIRVHGSWKFESANLNHAYIKIFSKDNTAQATINKDEVILQKSMKPEYHNRFTKSYFMGFINWEVWNGPYNTGVKHSPSYNHSAWTTLKFYKYLKLLNFS